MITTKQAKQYVLQVEKISKIQLSINEFKRVLKIIQLERLNKTQVDEQGSKFALKFNSDQLGILKKEYKLYQRGLSLIQGQINYPEFKKFKIVEDNRSEQIKDIFKTTRDNINNPLTMKMGTNDMLRTLTSIENKVLEVLKSR